MIDKGLMTNRSRLTKIDGNGQILIMTNDDWLTLKVDHYHEMTIENDIDKTQIETIE